nr:MAG TPA: hypothetical protein [Caudoviricetes sp.]
MQPIFRIIHGIQENSMQERIDSINMELEY